jgi:MoxR-like ATPase
LFGVNGTNRARTCDLMRVKHALFQLSYDPANLHCSKNRRCGSWGRSTLIKGLCEIFRKRFWVVDCPFWGGLLTGVTHARIGPVFMKAVESTAKDKILALHQAIGVAIKGKENTIALAIVALVAEGHLLIEDVPGVGKTTLGHALARSIACDFHRIQFTSDLLPSDVLGVSVYSPKRNEFEFKQGPIFANIVLADEINRTTPKTQSALLEAMNESQVTIENTTYPLPRPFMVLATQNPIEHHGTYPLPESQLDRFLMRIEVGYPDPASEKEILKRFSNGNHHHTTEAVLTPSEVLGLQEESRKVLIDEPVVDYMIQIVNRTRQHPEIQLGVSPRGTAALFRAAQAYAMLDGRRFVLPDDVKKLVHPVFEHRLVMGRNSRTRTTAIAPAKAVLTEILGQTPIPA